MLDPADLPDPDDDGFYRRYLESCRQLGVEPVSRCRVRDLVSEWNRTFGAAINATQIGSQRTH